VECVKYELEKLEHVMESETEEVISRGMVLMLLRMRQAWIGQWKRIAGRGGVGAQRGKGIVRGFASWNNKGGDARR
jgi:hypothetical protein